MAAPSIATRLLHTPVSQHLLEDRTFDIEFNGYLSNHAKHAVLALDRLGASPERIQEWWDDYTKQTPYGLSLHPVQTSWSQVKPCTRKEFEEWRGQKKNFQEMSAFLQQQLEEEFQGDKTKLIREYGNLDLICGMAGALTHGLIHLGWAIDAQSTPMFLVEGLTYLNFAHLPMDQSNVKTDTQHPDELGPLESFARVAQTFHSQNLAESWTAPTKAKYDESFHPELVPAGFQWELAKMLNEPHAIATELPAWLTTLGEEELWESMYRAVTYVYLTTRNSRGHGNFVVLHGLTSLWALEHICRMMNDEEFTRRAVGQFYSMLVVILATTNPTTFPTEQQLTSVLEEVPMSANDETIDWAQVVSNGIAEEEEHNIKLVYVMKELWNRYGFWEGFYVAAQAFCETPMISSSATDFKA